MNKRTMGSDKVELLVEERGLPWMVDVMLRVENLRISSQIRDTHLQLTGRVDPQTKWILKKLVEIEKKLDKDIAVLIKEHPAYPWFSKVKGIGQENIAKVIGLVDITRCPHVSSLWSFAGYSVVDGKAPKKKKGHKADYCTILRTMCWRLGMSLMRAKGPYYDYYLVEKEKYEARFRAEGKVIVPSSQLPKVKCSGGETRKNESDQFISKGHIHNMALRKMIKLFLFHLWLVWREAEGLPVSKPYAHDKLGHTHIIGPWDMTNKKS